MTTSDLLRPLRLRCADGAEPERKVTWLELFFDLVFVAAVAQVGSPLAEDYTLGGLGRYALLFGLIWWAWNGHTMFSTRFDTDDLIQRSLTLGQIFAVAVMAVNAKDALDSRSSAGFAAAYALMRLVLVAQYLRARRLAEVRAFTTSQAVGVGTAAALWLVSSVVAPPARFWLWGVAFLVDAATPLVTFRHTIDVPPHAAHLPERFGLFTIILLGEWMAAVMKGMESQEDWSVPAATSAFLGMAIAFGMWWWYFDGGAGAAAERRIRTTRHAWLFHAWCYAHFPLYLGIAVAGVGVDRIISVAHVGWLDANEAWILCGALGTGMAALVTVVAAGGGDEGRGRTGPRLVFQYSIAALTIAAGAAGDAVPPVIVIIGLTTLCLVQAALSSRSSGQAAHMEADADSGTARWRSAARL